jgi:predicted Zn-dependent protease
MPTRMEQLQAFLKDSPNDAFLQYAVAQEHISAGNDEDARVCFEKLRSEQPDYVATYYHLGKLLERKGEREAALAIYAEGIAVATRTQEQHALSELQSAKLELEYD